MTKLFEIFKPKKIPEDKLKTEETEIKPEIEEATIEPKVENKIIPEKLDPLKNLSLEEKTKLLTQKKSELEELKESRKNYYIGAKNFEEKMVALGLSDEQKKKIHEQIKSEGGEISDKINKIKEEYGFKPTPVEIYSTRLSMLMAELKRITDNLDSRYNELTEYLEQRNFGNDIEKDLSSSDWAELRDNFGDIPEVYDFQEKIKTLTTGEVYYHIKEFISNIKKREQETAVYKTPEERKNAENRKYIVDKLIITTETELNKAKKNEGRFAEKSPSRFIN